MSKSDESTIAHQPDATPGTIAQKNPRRNLSASLPGNENESRPARGGEPAKLYAALADEPLPCAQFAARILTFKNTLSIFRRKLGPIARNAPLMRIRRDRRILKDGAEKASDGRTRRRRSEADGGFVDSKVFSSFLLTTASWPACPHPIHMEQSDHGWPPKDAMMTQL